MSSIGFPLVKMFLSFPLYLISVFLVSFQPVIRNHFPGHSLSSLHMQINSRTYRIQPFTINNETVTNMCYTYYYFLFFLHYDTNLRLNLGSRKYIIIEWMSLFVFLCLLEYASPLVVRSSDPRDPIVLYHTFSKFGPKFDYTYSTDSVDI